MSTGSQKKLFSFIRLEGQSPRVENSDILYILSSWPKESDLWPHVLGSEGHNSKFSIAMLLLRIKPLKLFCIPRVALIFLYLLVL
jgi:hypothetical protein